MRVLALLFAFYFSVLGVLPCADAAVRGAAVAMSAATHQHGDTGSENLDWCSPLCQCHCCAGFALPVSSAAGRATRPAAPSVARRFGAWPVPALEARAVPAPWQPPRVG